MRTNRLTVLHVAREPRTGVWSAMKTLGRAQLRAGYAVHFGLLVTKAWPHQSELASLGWPVFPARSPEIFGTAAFLYHGIFANPVPNWLRALQADTPTTPIILHYHNAWLAGALVLKPSPTLRQIVTFHGIAGKTQLARQPLRRAVHRLWARNLVRRGVRMVSVDHGNLIVAQQLFGLNPSSFRIIPNGVDAPAVSPETLRHFGVGEPLRVCHVGALNDAKGWRITAEAVRIVAERGLPVRYTIAGTGPDEQRVEEWCELHAGIAEYLGHIQSPQDTLMPHCHVLSLPTANDGLPMAVLEAMASGLVVIATPEGGIPQAVSHGETGFLIHRSPAELAEKLTLLIERRQVLQRMSEAAAEKHRREFTSNRMRERYEALYRSH